MKESSHILIVDDEPSVREVFALALSRAGYAVKECGDGIEALQHVQTHFPSLIILDVDMPRMNGWKTLATLRHQGFRQPILMVTHVGDLDAKVHGLETGADDYLTKPCETPELVARVRALLRRTAPGQALSPELHFGNVVVDLCRKMARSGATPIRLTKTEYALLDLLHEHLGAPVSRETISARIWGTQPGNSHTLDTHVWRLRKKLGDIGERPRWILNAPGVGFLMASEADTQDVRIA